MSNFEFDTKEDIKKLIKEYMEQPHEGYRCGLKSFDDIIRLDKKSLAVFVSTPNTGKSTFINYYSYLMGIKNDWKTLLLSFEGNRARTALDMVSYYQDFDKYAEHTVTFDTTLFTNIKDIYDIIRQSKKERNIDMAVIDTFTNLYSLMGTGDTYSIGVVLTELSKIAKQTDTCIIVTAHTTKLTKDDDINPYNIFGSSHFYNLSDFIFSIKKVDDYKRLISELKALKIRDNFDKGKVGKSCFLEYHKDTKIFTEINDKPINPNDDKPFEEVALNTTPSNETTEEDDGLLCAVRNDRTTPPIKDNAESVAAHNSAATNEDIDKNNADKSTTATQNKGNDKLPTDGKTTQQTQFKRANIETLKNTTIQIYKRTKEKKPFQILPLFEAMNFGINHFKEKIDEVKKTEYHSKEYNSLKSELPCLMISCKCGDSKDKIISYNHLIVIDIDKKDNPSMTIEQIKDIVNKDPFTLYSSLSCGGRGLFAIIPIDDNGTEKDFKSIVNNLIDDYKAKGITLDGSCINPNKLRFISYDTDPYINENPLIYSKRKKNTTPIYKQAESVATKATNEGLTATEIARFQLMLKDIQEKHLILTLKHNNGNKNDLRDTLHLGSCLYSLFGYNEGLKYFQIMRSIRVPNDYEKGEQRFNECVKWSEEKKQVLGFGAFVEIYKKAGGDYDKIIAEEKRQYEEENDKKISITVPDFLKRK